LTFPLLEAPFTRQSNTGACEMKFHVPDMSCGHCTAAIEKGIKAKDPAAVVTTDLGSHVVSVVSTLPPANVRQAIADAGYAAQPA
jgi:copper chaperone